MRKAFHLAAAFLAGALTWRFFLVDLQALSSRSGTVGGEILFFPLIALIFYMGWAVRGEVNKLIEKDREGDGEQ